MGFLLSLFFGFFPMLLFAAIIYWLDRYEKEPKNLIFGAFLWGAIVAAGGAFILNTEIGIGVYTLTGSDRLTNIATGSIAAPIVEETLKALAVVFVFIFFFTEFDSILDGIVYAAITALGFAATENTYYIYSYGFLDGGFPSLFSMVFVRVILVGWQHPFYTAFFGIGLAAARLEKNILLKGLFILTGFIFAILTHSIHNTIPELIPNAAGLFLGSILDWSGWILMFLFILYMNYREKRIIQGQLAEEVSLGTLNARQYQISFSGLNRFSAGLSAFGTPQYRDVRALYQLCAELAHKKYQLQRMGREQGNDLIIADLRLKIAAVSRRLNGQNAPIQPLEIL
jgi:RsiW-degrading membrane proteinase PrsW (M82 family)